MSKEESNFSKATGTFRLDGFGMLLAGGTFMVHFFSFEKICEHHHLAQRRSVACAQKMRGYIELAAIF